MDPLAMVMRRAGAPGGYTDDDRRTPNCLCLRAGFGGAGIAAAGFWLADVEIQVEKLTDVITVPAQASSRRTPILVYVQNKTGGTSHGRCNWSSRANR